MLKIESFFSQSLGHFRTSKFKGQNATFLQIRLLDSETSFCVNIGLKFQIQNTYLYRFLWSYYDEPPRSQKQYLFDHKTIRVKTITTILLHTAYQNYMYKRDYTIPGNCMEEKIHGGLCKSVFTIWLILD